MTWYYKTLGDHVHVRVFKNGANCGTLVFRKNEFDEIRFFEQDLIVFRETTLSSED